MKNFRNLIFYLLLISLIFISGCTTLPSDDGTNDPIEVVELLAPTDFSITSGETHTVTWTKDSHAVTYIIYLYQNNQLLKSFSKNDSFELEIEEDGVYQAAIKVIGDGTYYYSSPVSDKVTFEHKSNNSEVTLPKLPTPTNVIISFDQETMELTVSFDDQAEYVDASGYKVYLYQNNILKTMVNITRNGGYAKISLPAGSYDVKVIASGKTNVAVDSDQSTDKVSITIEKSSENDEFDYSSFSNYYLNAKGKTGDALEEAIRTILVNTHKKQTSYDDLKTVLQVADQDPNNSKNVICIYSQQSVKGAWDGGTTWNREHVWPNSKGVGKTGPGADAHHLRPEDPNVNSTRGNYKIDYVPISSRKEIMFKSTTHTGCYIGSGLFEPADAVKGDVARIYFYLITRYSNLYSYLAEAANFQTLLEWNDMDPVSSSEIRRNEEVFKVQGNRNPFIDNPEFANLMWR